MKKACPIPSRPRSARLNAETEVWRIRLASFDRSVRRSNRRFKTRCVRLDTLLVDLIDSRRRIPLSRLNRADEIHENAVDSVAEGAINVYGAGEYVALPESVA